MISTIYIFYATSFSVQHHFQVQIDINKTQKHAFMQQEQILTKFSIIIT